MRSRYRIDTPDAAYFLTGTIVEWVPAFITKHESDYEV